ncbi:MAG: N-acetylmuramic acid 6-phosphate etherase [Caldilineaceae bacterium]
MTLSITETRNPASSKIDQLATLEMVKLINSEDAKVAVAVGAEAHSIATAIDAIVERMRRGGRLFYFGAGTSGRLGVLDASECPPTYSVSTDIVIGRIAGGDFALRNSVEGAEDDESAGRAEVEQFALDATDSVIGIAASGSTPYVLGAMRAARERRALVIAVACNRPCPMESAADIAILPLVGPEVVTGSTRMKAGTAQKLVLNTLSTGVMIRLGKTYGNLMVDVQAKNTKLRRRAIRIVEQACNLDEETANTLLHQCDGEVKTAIVAHLAQLSPQAARERLAEANGVVRQAVEGMMKRSGRT